MDLIQFSIMFFTVLGALIAVITIAVISMFDAKRFDKELKEFRELWMKESEDFHSRLLIIEERRNKFIFKE